MAVDLLQRMLDTLLGETTRVIVQVPINSDFLWRKGITVTELEYRLRKHIAEMDFEKAAKLFLELTKEEQSNMILSAGFDTFHLTIYAFMNYLLQQHESSEIHDLTSSLMLHPLCHLEGACVIALFHAKKAVELDPDNIEWYINLLMFEKHPDAWFAQTEVEEVYRRIKELESKNLK